MAPNAALRSLAPPLSSAMEVSFANSSALSAKHYRLVQSLETAKSPATALDALRSTLTSIKQRWSRGPVSNSSLHSDLLLALYCSTQRPTNLSAEDQDLLSLQWCLQNAVKLAGSDAKLEYRKTGYRACDEIFTTAPHALKLLLINTIRSDLFAPAYARQAQVRWIMGLRAAASPRLVIPELVPAVGERLLSMLSDWILPPHLARLALAALMNLLPIPCSTNETLLPLTRDAVVASLSPRRPPSSSASSSANSVSSDQSSRPGKSRRRSRDPSAADRGSVQDPGVLAALADALTPPSPLLPLRATIELAPPLLSVLQRTTTQEWTTKDSRWDYHDVRCGWLAVKVLRALEEAVLGPGAQAEEVVKGVLDYVRGSGLMTKIGLGQGLLLSCLSVLSRIPSATISSLPSPYADTFTAILDALASRLQSPREPNQVLLGLKGLRLLEPTLWTGKTESDGHVWGEKTWQATMSGLEHPDAEIRKETIRLLTRVDSNLVELHFTRLLASLRSLQPPSLTASSTSASRASTTSAPSPTGRQLLQARDRLVSLILEASAVAEAADGAAWANRVRDVVSIASTSPSSAPLPETVLPVLITATIDRFVSAEPCVQATFGRTMFEAGRWTDSVNVGLIAAATAGMGDLGENAEEGRKLSMGQIAEWLAGDGDASPPAPLIEPFLLCLLRLLAMLLPRSGASVPTLREEIRSNLASAASRQSTSDTQPLFSLLLRALDSTDGEDLRSALVAAAQQKSSETLVGFWENLQSALARLKLQAGDRPLDSPTRIGHERPLRYSAYSEAPSTSSNTNPRDMKGKGRAFDESARERLARGGRGGIGESLLGAGALALLGVEDGLQADSEEDEEETEHERRQPREDDDDEDEERTTPMQRSLDQQSRSRDRSSSEHSARADSPPADLLIDLAASNPFHDGL